LPSIKLAIDFSHCARIPNKFCSVTEALCAEPLLIQENKDLQACKVANMLQYEPAGTHQQHPRNIRSAILVFDAPTTRSTDLESELETKPY
jgi:hypothetical protein